MKNLKLLITGLLICVICFSLCACGITEDEAIGTWSGSYVYNGNDYSLAFVLSADGNYVEVMYKNGSYYKTEEGTWEIKSGDVVLHENGDTGTSTIYKYKDEALVNNDHKFYKN